MPAAPPVSVPAVFENGGLRFLDAPPFGEGDTVVVSATAPAAPRPPGRPGEAGDGSVPGESFPGESLLDGPDDPLAGIRFEGPPDLAENHVDYKLGRKTWP